MQSKNHIWDSDKNSLILIFITAVFWSCAVSEPYGDVRVTGTELLLEDGFPCLIINLPEGYEMKRDKCCDGVCTFVISKHFYDYPFSRKEKELFDKIRNQTAEDPYNEAVMHIHIAREEYLYDLSTAGSIEKNEIMNLDGKKITWSTVITEKEKPYKYLSQALSEHMYGNRGNMTKPAEKLRETFLIYSRNRRGISELQSVVETMRLSSTPCRDPRKIRNAELRKMTPEKQADTIMHRLEREEYEFDDDPECRYRIHGNELTNEEGDVYLINDLRRAALEKILPIGKKAVPVLVRWLRHRERQMRYIAFFSLEIITGEQAPFYFFEGPDESGWIEKYSKIFLRWYNNMKSD